MLNAKFINLVHSTVFYLQGTFNHTLSNLDVNSIPNEQARRDSHGENILWGEVGSSFSSW